MTSDSGMISKKGIYKIQQQITDIRYALYKLALDVEYLNKELQNICDGAAAPQDSSSPDGVSLPT